MKVYISNYRRHWLSPYTIIDYVFFWTPWSKCNRSKKFIPDDAYVKAPDWVEPWSDRLQPFCEWLQKFLDIIHPPIRWVKIDRWDTWSMDHTLAFIIVPMLEQLRDEKMGSPYVDDEDVPEYLRGSGDEQVHERWRWVLEEMIFAFNTKLNDNAESMFYNHNNVDTSANLQTQIGQIDCDHKGLEDFQKRVANGFKLFGKYYQGLWD